MRIQFLVLMVVAALLLGGCLETSSSSKKASARQLGGTAGAIAIDPETLLLATPRLLGPGADLETSVIVSKDGKTILTCSHGGFTQASPLWASTDSGATFRRMEPAPNQPFNGDCDVAIADDGGWYIVYDTAASATVAATTDQGRTWIITYLDGIPFTGVDRPWIEAGPGRTVYMNYQSIGAGEPQVQAIAVSTDGGLTWLHRIYSAPRQEYLQGVGSDMFVADGGKTIYIPVGRSGSAGRILLLAVSRDSGATWTEMPVAKPTLMGGIPTGSRGGDGTLYMAYSRVRQGVGDVVVHISKDDGKTWTGPEIVSANESFAGYPTVWIDARPDGSADLVWMTATRNDQNTTWQPAVARIHSKETFGVDFVGKVGPTGSPAALYEFSMVRHDAAGRAYVAFPLVTGPSCKQTPPFPSQVGSGNVPRNNQCEYLIIEDLPQTT